MRTARDWREYPQKYRYEAAKCKCGYVAFPPRLVCPQCKSEQWTKEILPREGKILTYTVIRVAPPQFVDETPYAVGIIELDNGVKLTTQIADCDVEKIDKIKKVRLEFRKIQEEGNSGMICYGYKAVPVN